MSSVTKSSSDDGAFYRHPRGEQCSEVLQVPAFGALQCQKRNDKAKKEEEPGKQAAFSVYGVPFGASDAR